MRFLQYLEIGRVHTMQKAALSMLSCGTLLIKVGINVTKCAAPWITDDLQRKILKPETDDVILKC